MKNLFRKVFVVLFAGMISTSVCAQDKIEPILGIDLVSHYTWRGYSLGNAAFQPTAGLAWKGLSLTAWGSFGFVSAKDNKEIDFTLAYQYKGFKVGITDYWSGQWSGDDAGKYFAYGAEDHHTFEVNLGYDFGFLAVNWFTNFAGYVGNIECEDGTTKQAFSSYFELSAPFRLATLDWKGTVGFVPYNSGDYYGVGNFTCTNVALRATKEFKIKKKFNLPVYAELMCNPEFGKLYFTAGVSFYLQ